MRNIRKPARREAGNLLEDMVMDNRRDTKSEYSRYYSYMYQATHGRKARVVRGAFFERDVIGSDIDLPK